MAHRRRHGDRLVVEMKPSDASGGRRYDGIGGHDGGRGIRDLVPDIGDFQAWQGLVLVSPEGEFGAPALFTDGRVVSANSMWGVQTIVP